MMRHVNVVLVRISPPLFLLLALPLVWLLRRNASFSISFPLKNSVPFPSRAPRLSRLLKLGIDLNTRHAIVPPSPF